ncbi:AMP-binding protein [Nocardiopsis baichengensis]|uniref:AMP-binding protein n=1 Tax=Nocardiopsis baichengensis TaxID=280240 RepID=UPI00034B03C3|nr:AMP-binding protein [Nocardiopsis baichengensis]
MSVHTLTLADVLREHRRSRPATTAAVDGPLRLSYARLDARTARLARALADAGAGPGDRVLYIGRNSVRLQEGLLAAARLGAVFVPANWRQSADELAFVLRDLAPAAVLWQGGDLEPAVREAHAAVSAEPAQEKCLWIRCDGAADAGGEGAAGGDPYEELIASAPEEDPAGDTDGSLPVLGLYTAAFDGRPACALLSHGALIAHNAALFQVRRIGPGFTFLNSGPLFHVGTMMFNLATFHAGGTNVYMPAFDAAEAARLIETERADHMFGFGPMLDAVAEANRGKDGAPVHDLSSLNFASHSPEWDAQVTVGTDPWSASGMGGYGQTQACGMLTYLALGPDGEGTAGRPSPMVRVRITGPGGEELPAGETGEITARGPSLFSGYHARPEATARSLRGGWHRTGDLGRREADGTITFIGPRMRMIKTGNENVYPAEVERALRAHPRIADAAVIGVPDDTWGQSVAAVVQCTPGPAPTEEEVVAHVRGLLASYKKPRRVVFTDALPKDGHLPDYDALDAAYGGGGYPGG